jgi:flagellar biosynthetic protein FliR
VLNEVLPANLFGFFLIFVRVGAIIMVAPALGEIMIPVRVRLAVAVTTALAIWPAVSTNLPAMPASALGTGLLILGEVLVGLLIGGTAKFIMASLHVGGSIIAFQTGLAVSQTFDPTQGIQAAIISSFLSLLGVVAIFASDLHLVILEAITNSYTQFPPGNYAPLGDFAQLAMRQISAAFALGVQIAAPFIVYGLVFYVGLGLIARLMPQLQVFFIAMPLNIFLGFVLMLFLISGIMMWFTQSFQDGMAPFLR